MTALGAQAERLGGGEDRRGGAARQGRLAPLFAAYGAAGATAVGAALLLGHDPLTCEAWLGTSGAAAVLVSSGLGVCVGAATVAATRVIVRRAAWGRALHAGLRPAVRGAGDGGLLGVAMASAVGEELLFRGLLVPLAGVVLSSLVFGTLHQIRGPARWGWMTWATLMGLIFGVVFTATGSLTGPIVAHVLINAANLRFLRDNEPSPRRRPLGGLLGGG